MPKHTPTGRASEDNPVTLPRIELPPSEPATPEEIERRRRLFEETIRLRDEIGPIGFDPAILIRELRDATDEQ